MRNLLIIAVIATFAGFASCSKYKAKLQVTVTDTLNKKLENVEVYLMTEQNAKEFQMGNVSEPKSYFSGKTSSDGLIKIIITDMTPIYGFVYKEGFYSEEFYIETPLDNKSKDNISVKLTPHSQQ
jgi:hypothetical protein